MGNYIYLFIDSMVTKKSRGNTKERGGDIENIASDAYDGAAAFGRFMAYVSLFVGCLFGAIFFIIGLVIIFAKPAAATESDATKSTESQKSNVVPGIIMCIFGIVISLISIVYWYMVTTFKIAAAATGVGNAAAIIDYAT